MMKILNSSQVCFINTRDNFAKKTIIMETKWNIDNLHSIVGFKVRHMMISNVSGTFGNFSAEATTEGEDFSTAKFIFKVAIDTINTGVADRDGHLKSADFFDAANYPEMLFHSTDVKQLASDELEITGNLTLRGVTKPVTLKAEFAGIAVDPYGQTKAGLSITGKIKRSDYGLVWSAVTEAGKVVVGDDVKLECEIQLIKQ
jgi:polyisoprenoid-binding protein YceI